MEEKRKSEMRDEITILLFKYAKKIMTEKTSDAEVAILPEVLTLLRTKIG